MKRLAAILASMRPGSLFLFTLILTVGCAGLSEGLRSHHKLEGFAGGAMMMLTLGLPMLLIVLVIQLVFGVILLRKGKRAWWRTLLVMFPALLLASPMVVSIVEQIPPGRYRRDQLARWLNGPLPPSVGEIEMLYSGGIDPTWIFRFQVESADYERIKTYREYTHGGGVVSGAGEPSSPTGGRAGEPGWMYEIGYVQETGQCTFSALNY